MTQFPFFLPLFLFSPETTVLKKKRGKKNIYFLKKKNSTHTHKNLVFFSGTRKKNFLFFLLALFGPSSGVSLCALQKKNE